MSIGDLDIFGPFVRRSAVLHYLSCDTVMWYCEVLLYVWFEQGMAEDFPWTVSDLEPDGFAYLLEG